MEEVEGTKEVMEKNEAVKNVHDKLLSRVQDLEEELKDSERKRWELIHGNTALQNKLKATREEEGRIHQKMASLQERLLSVLSSQVRKMVVLSHHTDHQECYVCVRSAMCDPSFSYCRLSGLPHHLHLHPLHLTHCHFHQNTTWRLKLSRHKIKSLSWRWRTVPCGRSSFNRRISTATK